MARGWVFRWAERGKGRRGFEGGGARQNARPWGRISASWEGMKEGGWQREKQGRDQGGGCAKWWETDLEGNMKWRGIFPDSKWRALL